MAFNWLDNFHHDMEKEPNYAEKALAAYRLGMRSGGSIVGVRVEFGPCCAEAAVSLKYEKGTIYHPDDAPPLPLADCRLGEGCQSVYRPVMAYEVSPETAAQLKASAQEREAERKAALRKKRRDSKNS